MLTCIETTFKDDGNDDEHDSNFSDTSYEELSSPGQSIDLEKLENGK